MFFNRFLSDYADALEVINGTTCILQTKWDKIYQKYMDVARDWLKVNQEEVLNQYNLELFKELWNQYASGNTSKWEMDSLCFYYGKHELAEVNPYKYGVVDFNDLPEEPRVEYLFRNKIPIYKLNRIMGTVLAKNDSKCSIILLTTTGIVNVKFTRDYYAMFKKQISQIQPDGKKKVVEKGWFTRGKMLMVTGFRREDTFVGKTYKNTEGHQLYLIENVVGDELTLRHDRYTGQGVIEEDYYE